MRFRALIADEKRKPYHSDELFFEVFDGSGKIVHKHDELEIQKFKGIYDQEIRISESANLGTWRVEVKEAEKLLGFKNILVSNQTSDHLKMEVKSNYAILKSDEDLNLEVLVTYDSGLFVKGLLKVQATKFENGRELTSDFKTFNATGKVNIKYKLSYIHKKPSLKNEKASLRLNFEFTESATRKKIMKSHQVKICENLCNDIEIVTIDKKMKPGFDFPFQVKIYTMDARKAIETSREPVKVNIVNHVLEEESEDLKNFTVELEGFLTNGTSNFSTIIQKNVSSITIIVTYMSSTHALNVSSSFKKASEYLKIDLITKK